MQPHTIYAVSDVKSVSNNRMRERCMRTQQYFIFVHRTDRSAWGCDGGHLKNYHSTRGLHWLWFPAAWSQVSCLLTAHRYIFCWCMPSVFMTYLACCVSPSTIDVVDHFALNQCRTEDITLKENFENHFLTMERIGNTSEWSINQVYVFT